MTNDLGRQVGAYRLLRQLGQGGFADVYLGEHRHLGTQAAIKLLHAPLGSPEALEQFRQEARTLATLIHLHIVRVLEFDLQDGWPYLVLDYAPGGSLRERHPQGTRVPLDTVVAYVQQVAQALQYAHDQRVVHRDIKPENLLLGRQGEVLLTDFGISILEQSVSRQQTREFAGTAAYAAPEQVQGHPLPASDQYALGMVVYEWLTGTLPFTGTLLQVIWQQVQTPPIPLLERVADLPPAVEQVVLRALAKHPDERFASVQAFANALEQASQATAPAVQMAAPAPGALLACAPAAAFAGPDAPKLLPPPTPPSPVPPAATPSPARAPLPPPVTVAPQATPAGWQQAPSLPPAPAATFSLQAPAPAPAAPHPYHPTSPQCKQLWVRALVVGVLVVLVMSGSLVGLGLAGEGPLAGLGAKPTATPFPAASITEFPLPTPNSHPAGITAGPDGSLWFTEDYGNQIGRITPTGQITQFPIPTTQSGAGAITAGPDGALWFTETYGNQIGRITPQGQITEFPLPTPYSHPGAITAGPNGNLWFTECPVTSGQCTDTIGRITPQGQITQFPLPILNSSSGGITAGPDGNLWFTEDIDKIGRITPQGQITEFPLPLNSIPTGITAGPDGKLWFTEKGRNKIGRITPGGQITEFLVPTRTSLPDGITAGSDGALWFTEDFGNKIGRITPGGQITEFPVPTLDSALAGITAGPDSTLWFTELFGNKIGRLTLNR